MKFSFGPMHRISIWLYLVGIPMMIVTLLDHSLLLGIFEHRLRLQLFVIAIILAAIAGIINLGAYVVKLMDDSAKQET